MCLLPFYLECPCCSLERLVLPSRLCLLWAVTWCLCDVCIRMKLIPIWLSLYLSYSGVFWYLTVFLSCSGAFGLLTELVCWSGAFGALTSRSHPSSPRGWWAARGQFGSCAGSGRSGGTRSTAASGGWVCCTQGKRSPTDTEQHAPSTAGARCLQSETKPHSSWIWLFGPLPSSVTVWHWHI